MSNLTIVAILLNDPEYEIENHTQRHQEQIGREAHEMHGAEP